MNILNKIVDPLLKGSVVKNPANLKRWQNALSVAVAVGAVVVAFVPSLEPYVNENIITKVFSAYAAINVYLTTASSDKIGL